MEVHYRIHTGEKPYQYVASMNIKYHIKVCHISYEMFEFKDFNLGFHKKLDAYLKNLISTLLLNLLSQI